MKFSEELSPKKLLKNFPPISVTKDNDTGSTKEIFNNIEALEADQKKSEERGNKLLEAFDDD